MPSTSKSQHNLMAAVSSNPDFAKKVGIPQSVGQDFVQADLAKTKKKDEVVNTKKKSRMNKMYPSMDDSTNTGDA